MLIEFELEALHKIISYAFFLEKFWDLGLLGFCPFAFLYQLN